MKPKHISRSALISECGQYRYWLKRVWDKTKPLLCWICLNPSKADARVDDNSVRRMVGFASAWGYGGIVVLNLFALRSTDPKKLLEHTDPVGPRNDVWLRRMPQKCKGVIAAWGAFPLATARADDVVAMLLADDHDLDCLGTTKDNHPKHPLRLRKDTERLPFRRPLRPAVPWPRSS